MAPSPSLTPRGLVLRKATAGDIAFIMSTERLPGYEWFVGQWSAERHLEVMSNPANAVLIGEDEAGTPQGFAILRDLDNGEGNFYLQRIAITNPNAGFGRALLREVTDHVFAMPKAHRFWLLVKTGNTRACHVYEQAGFTQEGCLRESHIGPDGSRGSSFMFSKLRPEWSAPASSAIP